MERTHTNESKFEVRNREIVVQRGENGHYKVTCKAKGGWQITKTNLRGRTAAWFILRCSQRRTKKDLQGPIRRGRITNLLVTGGMKMNGIEWIMTRMTHGVRPVILKAPRLFRQRVIYIEPTGKEGTASLRIIDPLTEYRTEPVNISREAVKEAIKTFSSHEHDEEPTTDTRG